MSQIPNEAHSPSETHIEVKLPKRQDTANNAKPSEIHTEENASMISTTPANGNEFIDDDDSDDMEESSAWLNKLLLATFPNSSNSQSNSGMSTSSTANAGTPFASSSELLVSTRKRYRDSTDGSDVGDSRLKSRRTTSRNSPPPASMTFGSGSIDDPIEVSEDTPVDLRLARQQKRAKPTDQRTQEQGDGISERMHPPLLPTSSRPGGYLAEPSASAPFSIATVPESASPTFSSSHVDLLLQYLKSSTNDLNDLIRRVAAARADDHSRDLRDTGMSFTTFNNANDAFIDLDDEDDLDEQPASTNNPDENAHFELSDEGKEPFDVIDLSSDSEIEEIPAEDFYNNTRLRRFNHNRAYNARRRSTLESPQRGSAFELLNRTAHEKKDVATARGELVALLESIRPDENLPKENRKGTPEEMEFPLMEHQKLGLEWLIKMEKSSNKGGILADDMGLGKTIQALALIVSHPSPDPDCKTTLIIAPVALMKQWEREIKTKLKASHKLSVFILHGTQRNATFETLKRYDVVLTTFGTLSSEFKRWLDMKCPETPSDRLPLLGSGCQWYRIIIDEAQCIKNRLTNSSKAACLLEAKSRFCMTGTPMMNNIGELFSLIQFLRIPPYNSLESFNMELARPFTGGTRKGKAIALQRLQALLRAILLRRTKKSKIDGNPIISLPERTTEIRHAVFSKEESDFYKMLETRMQIKFNKYMMENTVRNNFSNMLVALLRLRQACCHMRLVKDIMAFENRKAFKASVAVVSNLGPGAVNRIKEHATGFECPVCYDVIENPIIFTPCGHGACTECFARISDAAGAGEFGEENIKCPECRAIIDPKKITRYDAFKSVHMPDEVDSPCMEDFASSDEDSEGDDDESDEEDVETDEADNSEGESTKNSKQRHKEPRKCMATLRNEAKKSIWARARYMKRLEKDWASSAKIDKCLELLQDTRNRKDGEKTIVFSQFTSLLDLIEIPCQQRGWTYTRYDGNMTSLARNNAVISFSDDYDCNIMLVSLKAGNAGLNLVAASQVIILDPFWNPYIEDQAIDRAHRLGQVRPVRVHRILIENTVEDRIVSLQDQKRKLIESALDESAGKGVSRLGVEELGFLFGVNTLPSRAVAT